VQINRRKKYVSALWRLVSPRLNTFNLHRIITFGRN
jgi:hypothetical protein